MTGLVERKDPNARYIALSSLCSLCASPDMVTALKPHLPQVVACLSDADPAVKKRAIDVLVAACDRSSVESVVSQLVRQLPLADAEVRGELVVRVAILAERYAPSIEWCGPVTATASCDGRTRLVQLMFVTRCCRGCR